MEKICQSCGMPMRSQKDFGTNKDGSKNADYCVYCYQKGLFTNNYSMEETIEHNLNFLDEFNKDSKTSFTRESAKKEMLIFFPTLKRWKK